MGIPSSLNEWWAGVAPRKRAVTSALVLLDPSPDIPDRRCFATLDDALQVRPRFRDYADAVARLKR